MCGAGRGLNINEKNAFKTQKKIEERGLGWGEMERVCMETFRGKMRCVSQRAAEVRTSPQILSLPLSVGKPLNFPVPHFPHQ